MRRWHASLVLVAALAGCQSPLVQEHGGAKTSTDPRSGQPCFGLADGSPCDDGDACTQTDRCAGGVCVGADPVVCRVADGSCQVAARCDSANGSCSSSVAPDGRRCDLADGSGTGVCMSGTCAAAVCAAGHGDCNHDASDGCEHDVTNDAHNCGACGVVCADDYSCISGACVNDCFFAVGALDQSMIVDSASFFGLITDEPSVGQTIVTGRAGQLTGVAFGLHRCGTTGSADVRLTVYDSQNAAIATTVLPSSSIADDCVQSGPSESEHANTLFDLTSLCVYVDAAATLTLQLSLENVQQQTCDQATGTCNGDLDGAPCVTDLECGFMLDADVGNGYAAGTLVSFDGSIDGQDDLTFETFVK